MADYHDFLRDLMINAVAAYIFVFQIYYRRHGDRSTAIMLGLFNTFLFTIVIAMSLTEINIAAGFALFAVLSIISLRSVNIARVEVGYLFGAIALALINGISFPDHTLLALCNLVILLGAFVLDSPWIIKPTLKVDAVLEQMTLDDVRDTSRLRARLTEQYGMQVRHISIRKYNPENATIRVAAYLNLR